MESTHRQHVPYDTTIEFHDVLLVHVLVGHVGAVDEPQLHEGGDEELVDVTRHHLSLVVLPQDLIDLRDTQTHSG